MENEMAKEIKQIRDMMRIITFAIISAVCYFTLFY
jgi:hypothetical protein